MVSVSALVPDWFQSRVPVHLIDLKGWFQWFQSIPYKRVAMNQHNVMDTHTHTRNYYRKFGGTTTTTGTLEPNGITTIPSDTCAVPVPISADCDSGTRAEPAPSQQARTVALFVSTSLDTWTTDHAVAFNRDVQLNDTAFRRLDPKYYAWLRSRMNMAKLAVLAGQLTQEAFDVLREPIAD